MMRAHCLASIVLASIIIPAAADVLPPGSKWVSHKVRFENLADHPDYVFYLKNISWREKGVVTGEKDPKEKEPKRIELAPFPPNGEGFLSGNPIDGPKWLFAVPKKLEPNEKPLESWFKGDHPDVLKVQLMSGRRAAPESERRSVFWTVYRVDINDGKMTATVASEDGPSAQAENAEGAKTEEGERGLQRAVIGGAIGIVALGLGLFFYFRRKDEKEGIVPS